MTKARWPYRNNMRKIEHELIFLCNYVQLMFLDVELSLESKQAHVTQISARF